MSSPLLQEATVEEIVDELTVRLKGGFILAFDNGEDPLAHGDMSIYFSDRLGDCIKLLKYCEWMLQEAWFDEEGDS